YLWWTGWFSRSPGAVVEDTLTKANDGDYEGALANLASSPRSFYAGRPDLWQATCNAIGRKGKIRKIDVYDTLFFDRSALVAYVIQYQDGSSCDIKEYCQLEWGWWRTTLHETVASAAPDFDIRSPDKVQFALAASKANLNEEFTKIPRTGASLRL